MLDEAGIKPNRLHARKLAKDLLFKLSIINPPVRISSVIKHLGIDSFKNYNFSMDWNKISALMDLEDKIIIYNDTHPTVRKRFSFAHEVGHYLLNHQIQNDIFNLDSKDPREIEANMFAAELLMPFDWIKRDLKILPSIPKLAFKYWVSELAMGWRITKSNVLLLV